MLTTIIAPSWHGHWTTNPPPEIRHYYRTVSENACAKGELWIVWITITSETTARDTWQNCENSVTKTIFPKHITSRSAGEYCAKFVIFACATCEASFHCRFALRSSISVVWWADVQTQQGHLCNELHTVRARAFMVKVVTFVDIVTVMSTEIAPSMREAFVVLARFEDAG